MLTFIFKRTSAGELSVVEAEAPVLVVRGRPRRLRSVDLHVHNERQNGAGGENTDKKPLNNIGFS